MADKSKDYFNNRAWVSYISPYVLIVPDGEEPFSVDFDGINANYYDHGKLCSIVGMLPTLSLPDFKMIVCYDGALAIPKSKPYEKREVAIEFFNGILCQLLIGGILCEALDTRDVVSGGIYKKQGIYPVDFGESVSSQLHAKLRMRVAGSVERVILHSPNFIRYSEFTNSLNFGQSILEKIPNLTPEFLIRGVTEISYRNWSLALSNLWITIEQLTDHLWKKCFLSEKKYNPKQSISGRVKALREDNRTWSSSVKQEILYQSNIIDESIFQNLYPARQARNKLVHDGKNVDEETALKTFQAVKSLLNICAGDSNLPIENINPFRIRFFGSENNRENTVKNSTVKKHKLDTKANFNDWIELSKKH